MVIKMYDKIVELVGRDGTNLVGSQINKVVGAVRNIDKLQRKISKAQNFGLTRLEISYRFNKTFRHAYVTAHFHKEATNLLNEIVQKVLNDKGVLQNVYKHMSIYQLTHALSLIRFNLLVIGRAGVWLIVASTCHKSHFVGTMRSIKINQNEKHPLARLNEFVQRFSTPGSNISTYCLSDNDPSKLRFFM